MAFSSDNLANFFLCYSKYGQHIHVLKFINGQMVIIGTFLGYFDEQLLLFSLLLFERSFLKAFPRKWLYAEGAN